MKKPNELTNEELISRLQRICARSRRADVQLIGHLIEVETRGLHLAQACSSLYDFCLRRLGLSGGAAARRIAVARLARHFPTLLRHLESGKIHISHVLALRDALTAENVEELVAAVAGKTLQEVEQLLATRNPRGDVPESIEDLPADAAAGTGFGNGSRFERFKPLSERRCLLQVSISVELRAKLERARDLMRHQHPDGSLEHILDAALDGLLAKVEKARVGKTPGVAKAPTERVAPAAPAAPRQDVVASTPGVTPVRSEQQAVRSSASIPRAVRREVFERDGWQCTYVDAHDRRCLSRAFLEIDHIHSRALGGPDDAANLRLLCRAHNRHHAHEVFGKSYVEDRIQHRQWQRKEAMTGTAGSDAAADGGAGGP